MTASNNQINLTDITNNVDPVDDLHYEPIDRRYRKVQIALTALLWLLFAGLALFLLLLDNSVWCLITECVIIIALSLNLIIVNKAWRYKGFALRQNDLSYRSGIIFPTVTTIPYSRIQQVSVKQNPVSKFMNLYAVEAVNGAQALSSLTIPGLKKSVASQIKSILIDKMKDEHD